MLKRVLVTGGNKGIGLEVVNKFLGIDYEIVIVARDFSSFPLKDSKRITLIEYDLSNVKDLKKLVEEVGEIDVLIKILCSLS